MKVKTFSKRIMVVNPPKWHKSPVSLPEENKEEVVIASPNNKKTKKENNMTSEQIDRAEALVQNVNAPKAVKVVKKDRGLIERTESSKIILTEDNRQVLND